MGIDLVYVFAPKSVADVIGTYSPNLIMYSGKQVKIGETDLPEIQDLIEKVDAVRTGAWIGYRSWIRKSHLWNYNLIEETQKKPLVIDAQCN